jgi:hypothetical protein
MLAAIPVSINEKYHIEFELSVQDHADDPATNYSETRKPSANSDLSGGELCSQMINKSSNGRSNVQELGDIVSLLVTKITKKEQRL